MWGSGVLCGVFGGAGCGGKSGVCGEFAARVAAASGGFREVKAEEFVAGEGWFLDFDIEQGELEGKVEGFRGDLGGGVRGEPRVCHLERVDTEVFARDLSQGAGWCGGRFAGCGADPVEHFGGLR